MPKSLLNVLLTISLIVVTVPVLRGQKIKKTGSPSTTVSTTEKSQSAAFPELIGLTGQKAPNFTAIDMNGVEFNLENLRGKIVVINLWGTFCAPCIQEMPKLNTLVRKYKDKEVVFLSVAADDKQELEAFLAKHHFDYHVLSGAFDIIRQYAPKKKISSPTDMPDSFMMVLPTHLVIDRDGIVTEHFWGYSKKTVNQLAAIIEKLLAKKS